MKGSWIRRIIFIVISTALGVLIFFFLISLARSCVKVYKGLPSFIALFSMLFVGIGALSFLIFMPYYYEEARAAKDLSRRFCIISSGQFFILCAIGLLKHFLVYVPVLGTSRIPITRIWKLDDFLIIFGGFFLGVSFAFLVFYVFKSQRKKRKSA